MLTVNRVFIEQNRKAQYPDNVDYFNPNKFYPEYLFGNDCVSSKPNDVYELLRNCLINMGMDKTNQGTSRWNPLGEIISPGQTVLIKPNWVMHFNANKKEKRLGMECLITHPSLVRAICDYCVIALKGKGKIIIADAPMQDCDLEELWIKAHYYELFDFYKEHGVNLEFKDLRAYQSIFNNSKVIIGKNDTGSKGVEIDFSAKSIHERREGNRNYQVDNYSIDETQKYHGKDKHIYSISEDVLNADVIVNICKPKSHRLAGFTASMKNLVGVCYYKASLPHRTVGATENGGDEYRYNSFIKKVISNVLEKKIQHENEGDILAATFNRYVYIILIILVKIFWNDPYVKGIWYGNDTIWRTVVDLNYIAMHIDSNGEVKDDVQRKIINFGDMIVAGDHNGPCAPSAKKMGIIMAALDTRCFDLVFSKMAGFDKITPMIKAIKEQETDYLFGSMDDIEIVLNGVSQGNLEGFIPDTEWRYKPHDSWYIR